MEKLLTDHQRQIVDTCDYLDLVSFRNPQHNILNLRDIVGDEKYLTLMDKFAGNYTRFPTAKNALEAVDDLILITLWEDLNDKKKNGTTDQWNAAEAVFIKHGQKMGLKFINAKRRARAVTKELVQARNWVNDHEKKGTEH
jgi:hypothetical protein